MRKFVVCLAVALCALCAQAADSVEKQIITLEQKWAQAAKASDVETLAPMLADGFVMVEPDGRVLNKSQVLDDAKKSKMVSVEESDLKVTSYGNVAVVTGIWKAKGTGGDGKPEDETDRFVDTWHKGANGQWQCLASGNAKMQ